MVVSCLSLNELATHNARRNDTLTGFAVAWLSGEHRWLAAAAFLQELRVVHVAICRQVRQQIHKCLDT